MKSHKASAQKSAKLKKIAFNAEAFDRIAKEAGAEVVELLLPQIVIKTLEAKHGSGLLGSSMREDPDEQKRVINALSSLVPAFSASARISFAMMLEGLLSDSDMRKYLIKRTAAMAGREGGRTPSGRSRHLQWLERRIKLQEIQSALGELSVKEHFRELLTAEGIDGEDDDGNLRFTETALEQFGWEDGKPEPVISLNSVRKAMTAVRNRSRQKD